MTQRRATQVAILIVAVAIVLRAVAAIVHPYWFPDSVDYDALGKAIAHGLPYEVNGLWATRMPGYPVVVAAAYAVCGPSVRAVLLVQALMGGVSTLLVYLMGRRVSLGVGLLAAGLTAVDPLSIGFSAALLSEGVFTVLMLAGLWILLRLMDGTGGRVGTWVALGVVWGAAVYMRASALWCVVPLVVWGAWWIGGRSALRGSALAVVVVLVALLPWQYRNFGLFHERFFRMTTLEGISLYEAVYPGADGGPKQDILTLPPEMQGLNEAQRDDEWGRRAWAAVRADPVRVAGLAVRKIGRTWSPWLNAAEFRNGRVAALLALWHIPLFILAAVGIFIGGMSFKMKGLLVIPIGYFTAVHALFLGSVRYRVPLMPLVCLFAAAGVMAIVRKRAVVNELPDTGSNAEQQQDEAG